MALATHPSYEGTAVINQRSDPRSHGANGDEGFDLYTDVISAMEQA